MDDTRLWDETEAAEYLGYAISTLRTKRSSNTGPAYLKLGRNTVRYRQEDVTAWAASHRQSTLESR